MTLTEEIAAAAGEISIAELDSDLATVTKAFPEERYLAFLNDELTAEEFVAELIAHVEKAAGPPAR